MAKIALVMGATGLVGAELTKQLAGGDEYSHVVAFSRRAVAYSDDKITNQVLDFKCLEASADLFHGNVLFLCLGTTKKQAGSIAGQRQVDFDYPLQVASIAAANGVDHCIVVSSSGADRHSFSPYLSMKGDLEQQLKLLGLFALKYIAALYSIGCPRPGAKGRAAWGNVIVEFKVCSRDEALSAYSRDRGGPANASTELAIRSWR